MAARKSLTPWIFSYYTSRSFGYEKYNELRPKNQARSGQPGQALTLAFRR